MERSFHSSFLGSPFSPRSRQSIGQKRPLQGSLSSRSLRKSSRFSTGGHSTQIIFKSQANEVERFGQPLPVLITEALTFVERNTLISAGISECGFAWVVCGRRLLIWQYRQTPAVLVGNRQKKHGLSNQCFELQLPQSDLSHRAELVSVFLPSGSNVPSCIAVSPEGVVRYWPGISHEGVSVEQNVDLAGQECDSLTNVEGLGCILATTTCTVVLVQPHVVNGRHSLSCRSLRSPSGWLGGLSKRMSSLIFGPISTDSSAETRLVRVLAEPNQQEPWIVYVLAGHSLQKWRLSIHEPEQLVFVAELNRLIRDNFYMTLWENCAGDQSDIDTWLLDIQLDRENIVVLAAAVNLHVSPQVHYAFFGLETCGNQAPTLAREFKLLKMSGLYREDNPSDTLSFRFLLCGSSAYVFNQKLITVIRAQEEPDTLEFNTSQDSILGASICINTPIFFSRNHGPVSVSANDMGLDMSMNITMSNTVFDDSLNDSFAGNNLSVYNMDPVEMAAAHTDTLGQMKSAFLFYVRNQQKEYQEILNELFPTESAPRPPSIDSILDKVIVSVCTELINDIPAGDPRWSKDTTLGIGSSTAMQVLHQLEDKQKALLLFLRFLRDSGLWTRLGAHTIRGTPICTVRILGEISEKLMASVVLKSQTVNTHMEKAIEKAVEDVDIKMEFGLTCQDIFYSRVSEIQKGIQELIHCCEDAAHSNLSTGEVATTVQEINEILLAVLKEVMHYRKANSEIFTPSDAALNLAPDYLPWTSANGSDGIIDSLWEQHSLTYNYGMKIANTSQLKKTLCEQLVAITDFILDGRKAHIESIKGTKREEISFKQYCLDRHKLIQPFLQSEEWEGAAQLAEKYLDFEALVVLCEATNNQSRLDDYMDRFQDDFCEYVYNWYLKENKQAKLLDICRRPRSNKMSSCLNNFLTDHPSLSWMQQIFDRKFLLAAETLKNLGHEEEDSVVKQKTIYSLSKLSRLAGPFTSDSDSYVENLNKKLDLISYQEDLPDYLLQHFGYNTVKLPVIPAKDMIKLYVCAEYSESTEVEFKKALDLLNYIEDKELKEELHLHVWRRAILKNSWNFTNINSPIELLQDTVFFKVADLSITLGADPSNLLPPLEALVEHPTLGDLQSNKNFLYLIKSGYEHIQKNINCV